MAMKLAGAKINPCLWFDSEAENAARFYCSVFKNSRIGTVSRYGKEGTEIHGKAAGSVMAVEFELDGQKFAALNGGPQFKFSEAISFQVHCDDQAEVDYFWSKLGAGGEEGPCGWLKDKYGLSWQIVPDILFAMLTDKDQAKSQRVTKAFLQMKKFDIAALKQAYAGETVARS
jgi:predicted 3-demethylubiquinone-9 3-methyltransferase (glyoxalase superfamily)